MVHWIIEKLFAKKQGPNSKGEKVGRSSPFRDRQANIVAYRGNVCNQKGSIGKDRPTNQLTNKPIDRRDLKAHREVATSNNDHSSLRHHLKGTELSKHGKLILFSRSKKLKATNLTVIASAV